MLKKIQQDCATLRNNCSDINNSSRGQPKSPFCFFVCLFVSGLYGSECQINQFCIIQVTVACMIMDNFKLFAWFSLELCRLNLEGLKIEHDVVF